MIIRGEHFISGKGLLMEVIPPPAIPCSDATFWFFPTETPGYVYLQGHGFAIALCDDGTWMIADTSGG